MTMLERVAKAIYEAAPVMLLTSAGTNPCEWKQVRNVWLGERYWAQAEAALEAMREPTGFMLDMTEGMGAPREFVKASAHWRAMIDAALSESLPTSDKQDHISRP
jgi:hypothetical protein